MCNNIVASENKHCNECKQEINNGISVVKRKPCVECHSEIPIDAKKCKECSAYQDKRKYLQFSSTILSLLIALISVTSIAIPPIIKAVESLKSDIVVTPISLLHRNMTQNTALELRGEGGLISKDENINATGIFLQVVVTNKGKRSGVLSLIEVQLKDVPGYSKGNRWIPLSILGSNRPQPVIIEAGKSIIVTGFYHNDPRGAMEWCSSYDKDREFPIRLSIINESGDKNQSILDKKLKCKVEFPEI